MTQQDFKPSLKRATVLQIAALTIFASMLLFVGAEFQRTTLKFIDHANQVISAERELFRLTLDMETGLRGFQLTGSLSSSNRTTKRRKSSMQSSLPSISAR